MPDFETVTNKKTPILNGYYSEMIKIAYIIDTIVVETAGTEKQLLLLLNNLNREKFKPYLCVLHRSDWLDYNYQGDPYFLAQITSFKTFSALTGILGLAQFLKRERIDIVQTFFSDANKAGILAARIAGIKCIVSSRRNQGYWHTWGELAVLRLINRWVDLFIANSQSTCNWAQQVEQIPAKKIEVIYNGLDLTLFGQNSRLLREKYRQELGLLNETLVVGIVANLRPVKAHDVLLRAAKLVIDKLPNAQFLLIGDEEEQCAMGLRTLVHELGIADNVHFLGQRTDVSELLSTIDIGVLSSNSESSSNATAEYLAAGLPVVSTDVGGAREAIEDGWNGFVVEVGDYVALAERILEITLSGSFLEMGKRGRQRAEELFSQASMLQRHEGTYQRLLNECSIKTKSSPLFSWRNAAMQSLNVSIRDFAKFAFSAILGQRPVVKFFDNFNTYNVTILMYHRISDTDDANGLSIGSEFFEQQLKYLKKMYSIISLDEAVSRLENGNLNRNYIVLTFDDGFQDNYSAAYPLLQKYEAPATVFIACNAIETGIYHWTELDEAILRLTCDTIDLSSLGLNCLPVHSMEDKWSAIKLLHSTLKSVNNSMIRDVIVHLTNISSSKIERIMMTWDQVKELSNSSLVAIASHTVTHPILTKISLAQAIDEIHTSKGLIEGQIGKPVHFFSYPNGGCNDFNDETVDIVKTAGYRAACTTISGANRKGVDLFRLRRIDVTNGMCRGISGRFSGALFAAYVSGIMGKIVSGGDLE